MNIDEFLTRVAGEPDRTVAEDVWTVPEEVMAKANAPGGLSVTEMLASGRLAGRRDVRYGHVLGAPASSNAIDAWQRAHPAHRLPADLRALVARVNGIHLWASVEEGRAYVGLAPIEEWKIARVTMYGPDADRDLLDDRYVALSYHQDGAAFVVLDGDAGGYFLMDAAGPDRTCPIADDVDGLLDWMWKERLPPLED